MAAQVPWDKYEIALLIDAFLSVENRIADRNVAIEEVSEKLRNRARMQQIVVDDTFRNVAGITLQYRAVEKLFFPNRWGPSASGLFAEIVNLYRYQRNEFDMILDEARKQLQENAVPIWAQKGTRREQFVAWLENKGIKNPHPNIIAMTFDRVTEFAEYSKALKCSIWDIGDVKVLVSLHQKLSGNHLFKVRLGEHAKIFEKTWKYYWQMLSDWESILKLQEEQAIAGCTVERVEENYALPENRRVVFDDSLDLSHCTPIQATIFGKTEINFNKWEDVLLFVCRELVGKFPLKAKELLELTNSHLFVSTPATLKKPLHICDTFFTEGSFSTADLIHRIKVIVEAMGVSCDILRIYFERPEDFGEKMLSAFSDWLIEVCQLGEAEVQNHLAAIKELSKIMIMDGIIAKELYCCKTIEDVIVELNAIKKTPQYRNLYQYRFEDILKRYLAFRSEKIATVKIQPYETQLPSQPKSVPAEVQDNKQEQLRDVIYGFLSQKFQYGFKITSAIDCMKMRLMAEENGVVLPSDDEIKEIVCQIGIVSEGKVYVITEETKHELKVKICNCLEDGSQAIFYDVFMEVEEPWLTEKHIYSVDALKSLLRELFSLYYFAKTFMYVGEKITELQVIEQEIKRIWGRDIILNFVSMHNRLPWIPLEKIKHSISGGKAFVWNSPDTYANVDFVYIAQDKQEEILDFVTEQCRINGFVSINELPIDDLATEYYQLSPVALGNIVYQTVLQERFTLNGKLISSPARDLDIGVLMRKYCRGKDMCTFEELESKVVEYTGQGNRQAAFEAAYDTMVRVNQENFVADYDVWFDVEAIDALLETMISDDFAPIKSITTFAAFPVCGQAWNLFLLESYCYRYSKKFSLQVQNFSDKNAGVIIKKRVRLKYKEILAIVLSKANINLTVEEAGEYLYAQGYMAKRKYAALDDIIQCARKIKGEI